MANGTNILIKVIDNAGTVFVFTTPKQHSGSIYDVVKYGTFNAIRNKDGEEYMDIEGNVVDSTDFNMVKLLKLMTGKERTVFDLYVKQNKIRKPVMKIESKVFVPPVAPPKKTPEPKKEPLPKAPELLVEGLGNTIEELRRLAKDPAIEIIFRSFIGRTKMYSQQTANSIMQYVKKHCGVDVSKKSVMKFFMELQRLHFGRYDGGPKNRKGWVSPLTMKFLWVNCSADNVARCAVGMSYETPLLSKIPTKTRTVKEEAEVIKPEIETVTGTLVVEQPIPTLTVEDDLEYDFFCLVCDGDVETQDTESGRRFQCTNEKGNCEHWQEPDFEEGDEIPEWCGEYEDDDFGLDPVGVVIKPVTPDTPPMDKVGPAVEEVRAWLMDLTESGARGDTSVAWLTFNKMLKIIQ